MSIYLDHHATTPLRPEVWEAMQRVERGDELHTNPSSTHKAGLTAARAVKVAREQLAGSIGARPEEILFTGGGSEAINLAIKGVAWSRPSGRNHFVSTRIEHHAVLHTLQWLEGQGYPVTLAPVDLKCRVSPEAVAEAIRPETALVSVMLVNNEVGSIQPVAEIGRVCRERGVLLHVDAVQALGKLPVSVEELGCDLLSVSAHKVYGPKGVGALYVRPGTPLVPLIHGGRQESGLRAGTQNVAGIAGFGEAVRLADTDREASWQHALAIREQFLRLPRELNAVRINGDPANVVPHCVSLTLLYCDAMTLSTNLSVRGIYVSVGSACTSGDVIPSHVLTAMGLSDQAAFCTIRLTSGRDTRVEDAGHAIDVIQELAAMLREVTMPEDIGKCTEDCPCFLTA